MTDIHVVVRIHEWVKKNTKAEKIFGVYSDRTVAIDIANGLQEENDCLEYSYVCKIFELDGELMDDA